MACQELNEAVLATSAQLITTQCLTRDAERLFWHRSKARSTFTRHLWLSSASPPLSSLAPQDSFHLLRVIQIWLAVPIGAGVRHRHDIIGMTLATSCGDHR